MLKHSARTAAAAAISLAIARLFRLPEAYWAAVTTLIVMQSTVGAALKVSLRRLIGTILGAAVGALFVTFFGSGVPAFGAGVFLLGIICAALARSHPRLPEYIENSTYRFGAIALAVVMLLAHNRAPWIIALHRIAEISIGIFAGLMLTVIWPEDDAGQKAEPPTYRPEAVAKSGRY